MTGSERRRDAAAWDEAADADCSPVACWPEARTDDGLAHGIAGVVNDGLGRGMDPIAHRAARLRNPVAVGADVEISAMAVGDIAAGRAAMRIARGRESGANVVARVRRDLTVVGGRTTP
jgi:hypothetical protein